LLLIGVFAVGRISFAGAGAADVHARGDVTAAHKVRMQFPIALEAPIVFAVGQVFEDGRKFFVGLGALGHIEVDGQLYPVFHRDPGLDLGHAGINGG
jgi:hypothetical protein